MSWTSRRLDCVVCPLNAGENGVAIVGAKDAAVSRVVVRGSQSGVLVQKATAARIENCVLAANRTGLTLVEAEGCVAANLTLANNSAIGMTISGCRGCRIFNNLVVGSQIGVSLADSVDLALDHNIYVCNFTGSFGDVKGRPSRQKVGAWASLTGQDHHSLMLPVTLSETYAATNTLDWSPNLPVTAPWGAKELAAAKAPADDIDGKPRGERQGVGAVGITAVNSPRPADGTFEITGGAGVASAGLYTPAGDLVAYLFQNQPLPKGRHEFWLPSRTWTGQPLTAGDYAGRSQAARQRPCFLEWKIRQRRSGGQSARALERRDIRSRRADRRRLPLVALGRREDGAFVGDQGGQGTGGPRRLRAGQGHGHAGAGACAAGGRQWSAGGLVEIREEGERVRLFRSGEAHAIAHDRHGRRRLRADQA